jgi:tetratricopeptide (TPR) repeat protein
VAKLNWVFFREEDEFEESFGKLDLAIHTDFEWVQFHSEMQNKALKWERHAFEKSLLLRGKELNNAEGRLRATVEKDPPLTELQIRYIAAGRKSADEQRKLPLRVLFGIVSVIVSVNIIQDRSWYRFWPVPLACPSTTEAQVEFDPQLPLADELKLQLLGDTGGTAMTERAQCIEKNQAPGKIRVVAELQKDGKVALSITMDAPPAYRLDFLPEIRELGPQIVSVDQAGLLINASAEYSVGNYETVTGLLLEESGHIPATLKAQAYLYQGEFEKSRIAYDGALKDVNGNGNLSDMLNMGKALAWWRPILEQKVRNNSEFLQSHLQTNCEEARNIYTNLLSVSPQPPDYYYISLIAAHYCGKSDWGIEVPLPSEPADESNLKIFAEALSNMSNADSDVSADLRLAAGEILYARFELSSHYLIFSEQPELCNEFIATRQWYMNGVFTSLDRENVRYLLRQSCN